MFVVVPVVVVVLASFLYWYTHWEAPPPRGVQVDVLIKSYCVIDTVILSITSLATSHRDLMYLPRKVLVSSAYFIQWRLVSLLEYLRTLSLRGFHNLLRHPQ